MAAQSKIRKNDVVTNQIFFYQIVITRSALGIKITDKDFSSVTIRFHHLRKSYEKMLWLKHSPKFSLQIQALLTFKLAI